MEAIRVSGIIPATPDAVYTAWLDSDGHSALTGKEAVVDGQVGGEYTACEGYISGKTLDLKPGRKIVQAWRTRDFRAKDPDSRLEVRLEERADGTTAITFLHSGIPPGLATRYENSWVDRYLTPMRRYFDPGKRAEAARGTRSSRKKSGVKATATRTLGTKAAAKKTGVSATKSATTQDAAAKTKAAATKKATAKKAASQEAAAKTLEAAPKTAAKKATSTKTTAKRAPAKKAPAKKAAAKKTTKASPPPAKKAASKKDSASKRAPSKKAAAKKTTAKKTAAKKTTAKAARPRAPSKKR